MNAPGPVLIAGAGLAGLSTAFHLGTTPYRLIEQEEEVGGLCRSVRENGFTFDYTGHLLHLRRNEIRDLVGELLGPECWQRIDRHSGIYSHGTYTEYPFQVNTHGLPRAVIRDCVMGFAESMQSREKLDADPSFRAWALATFGPGICRHFLFPYNEKLFRTDLEHLTADWVSWSIPKPSWPDVVRGALGTNRKAFGYNPQFLYPLTGGIDHLPRALASRIQPPLLGCSIDRVNAARREARLSTGEQIRYRALVSTLPLDALVGKIEDAPASIHEAASQLRAVSVLNLNLGFDAPCSLPYHWVYFPEAEFPFYRVGVYSNLTATSVPQGCSSFYVEISHDRGKLPPVAELTARSAAALLAVGLVPPSARLVVSRAIHIPVAYVVHDRERRAAVPQILAYLAEHGIDSIGRYGNWEYAAMEDALWQGREAAARHALSH